MITAEQIDKLKVTHDPVERQKILDDAEAETLAFLEGIEKDDFKSHVAGESNAAPVYRKLAAAREELAALKAKKK